MEGRVLSAARAAAAMKLDPSPSSRLKCPTWRAPTTAAVVPLGDSAATPIRRVRGLSRPCAWPIERIDPTAAGWSTSAPRYPVLVLAMRMPLDARRPTGYRTGARGPQSLPPVRRPARPRAGDGRPRHLKDALREIHGRLVKEGLRDEITLIAGGGIALAEHMAKAIICGADLVAAFDTPLLVRPRLPRLPRRPDGRSHRSLPGGDRRVDPLTPPSGSST